MFGQDCHDKTQKHSTYTEIWLSCVHRCNDITFGCVAIAAAAAAEKEE